MQIKNYLLCLNLQLREGVGPDQLHVEPIGYDAMLNGVLKTNELVSIDKYFHIKIKPSASSDLGTLRP